MADRRSIRTEREAPMLFPTTIAGSLPKPEWLAEPNTLWAPWRSKGDELARAKRDATMLAVKLQEDAGIDIVTEGEQARQHFVHGFLDLFEEAVDEMLTGLFALSDDIDAGVLLQLHRQHGGVALGAGELVALRLPGGPERVRFGQPFRLRQRACDRGWKQH